MSRIQPLQRSKTRTKRADSDFSRSEKGEKGDKGDKEKEKGDHESIMASTFHRMRHPSGRKSGRPSTSDGVAMREKPKSIIERDSEPEEKTMQRLRPKPSLREKSRDREVLRKRTAPGSTPRC